MKGSDAFDIGAGVPGWVLRGALAMVVGAIVAVLATGGVGGPMLVVLGVAGLLSTAAPASPAPALLVVLVALTLVATSADPFSAQVLVLVPMVHLLHVGCGIAGLAPMSVRLHLSALRAPAIRFVVVQVGVLGLAALIALAPLGRPPVAVELTAILGVAVIAFLLVSMLNRVD